MQLIKQPYSRSQFFPRHCPVSVDPIASRPFRNERYEAVDCKIVDLFLKKCLTLAGPQNQTKKISLTFSHRENLLPNSICPELKILAELLQSSGYVTFLVAILKPI